MQYQAKVTFRADQDTIPPCPQNALRAFAAKNFKAEMQVRAICPGCPRKFRPDAWLDGQAEDGISEECLLKETLRRFLKS